MLINKDAIATKLDALPKNAELLILDPLGFTIITSLGFIRSKGPLNQSAEVMFKWLAT